MLAFRVASCQACHMATQAARRKHREEAQSTAFTPQTGLGKHLWKIRRRIVASGERLLNWDEIDREVAERRGER